MPGEAKLSAPPLEANACAPHNSVARKGMDLRKITCWGSEFLERQSKLPQLATREQAFDQHTDNTFGTMWGSDGEVGKALHVVLAMLLWIMVARGTCQPDPTLAEHGNMTVPEKRCCLGTVAAVTVVGATGAIIALDQAWYAQFERTAFHGFNDGSEWLLMDKTGHIFSTYAIGSWGHAVLSHCGASESASRWVGGTLGLAFMTGVEILDGTSSGWGFSGWDMVANTAGAGLFIGQDIGWGEQRLRLKLSSHFTDYAAMRPDLLGITPAERVLKDYNGVTLWLSGNVVQLSPWKSAPPWLNIAAGYGAEGLVTAIPDESTAITGAAPYRQYYLSPDMDLTRIRTKSRTVRTLLFLLNSIKIPAPALEIQSTGKVVGHWLYF